jgi:esterase/lipase superfamily enzyme
MKNTHAYTVENKFQLPFLIVAIALVFGFTACAGKNPYIIELMPAPDVYTDESIDPFAEINPKVKTLYQGMLYASDRKPTSEPGKPFYLNERCFVLRLGVAKVEMGEGQYTFEEARRISLLKNRSDNYPLKVTAVEETGILDRSFSIFTQPEVIPVNPKAAPKRFAELIDAQLAISKKKDVYIYVHGYKVVFSNPVLVATELWHYLAYDGVFIAFAWPSTPERLAYAADLETAVLSAYNLRKLLEFLAEDTEAERIHILGYSAGTRVVLNALSQLSLIHRHDSQAETRRRCRIGRIILVGSDFDRQLFGALLAEGMLKIPETMTVYVSKKDKALGISRWLFRRDRLGQIDRLALNPTVVHYLNDTPQLAFIDVSDVEGSTEGSGHAYFRKSPWASSDILMALMYDLNPNERGLITTSERPIWTFPNDYIERLKTALKAANPNLFKGNP